MEEQRMILRSGVSSCCLLLLLGLGGMALAGCGSEGLSDMVPIKGKVTYNGNPLTKGEVLYVPSNREVGRTSRAKIQPDGTFEMTTLKEGDGVMKGEYGIAVILQAPRAPDPPPGQPNIDRPATYLIPEHYARADQSGFKDTVDANHSGYKELALTGEMELADDSSSPSSTPGGNEGSKKRSK